MTKQGIETPKAPAAIGTYSQGIRAGGAIWLSGQLPLDPATGQLLTGDMRDQVRQVMRFAGPAGLTAAIATFSGYEMAIDSQGLPIEEARTTATMVK